jgi:sialate O-acetylesterase
MPPNNSFVFSSTSAVDVHPKNKQDVGRRLSLIALAKVYGRTDLVWSGPIYRAMKVEGRKIHLWFDHVGGGLAAKGGKLTGFAIAGARRKFVWAQAKIDPSTGSDQAGGTVVVWHKNLRNPVAVRYGWDGNPVCNLYNREGLPASPFRTDDWPGISQR